MTVLRAVLLIALRLLVMSMLAIGLGVIVNDAMARLLPPPTSFDRSFDRLGQAAAIGAVTGALLGGALTHRLARRRYDRLTRLVFGLIAAAPLLLPAAIALNA